MANNIKVGPNSLVALQDIPTDSMLSLMPATKVSIVYKADGSYQSWVPGRPINAFNSIEMGKGYILIAKQEMDLSPFFVPPVRDGIWAGTLVNIRDFGAVMDGRDNSQAFTNIYDTYGYGEGLNPGIAILIPKGLTQLSGVRVPSGYKIFSEQYGRNNVHAYNPSQIMSNNANPYTFNFDDGSMNNGLYGLNINGDYLNAPNLEAAIRFTGTFNTLQNNNVCFTYKHAVLHSSGGCLVHDNNFQGLFGQQTYPDNGYLAAYHILAAGDFWMTNNEIGAAASYGSLRDPDGARHCAVYAEWLTTSYFHNNLLENADQVMVWKNGIYSDLRGNRFELGAICGLNIIGPVYNSLVSQSRFGSNSLLGEGVGIDFKIANFAASNCRFSGLQFSRLGADYVAGSFNRSKYHIQNLAIATNNGIDNISHLDTDTTNGLFDKTTAGWTTFTQPLEVSDTQNVKFKTLTAGSMPGETLTGSIKIVPGTDAGAGGLSGMLQLVALVGGVETVIGSVGYGVSGAMPFNLYTPGTYQFINGGGQFAKAGDNDVMIQSTNNGAQTLRFVENLDGSQVGIMKHHNGLLELILADKMKLYCNLETDHDVMAVHFLTQGVPAAAAAGPAAGTGAAVGVSGTDAGISLSITTGATPVANDTLATITFSKAFALPPRVILSAIGGGTKAAEASALIAVDNITATKFDLVSTHATNTVPASTTLLFNFFVIL